MTTKPIIGISANRRNNPDFNNTSCSYVPTDFVTAVEKSGGIPLILPIGDKEAIQTYISMVDKIILTGGQNVDPSFYGEEKRAKQTDDFLKVRDYSELLLIEEAMQQHKPIFGVCRGTQLLNVALGGNLNQHIDHHFQDASSNQTTHSVIFESPSKLEEIYGDHSEINSFHRQSIKKLAPQLEVIARDPRDNTIEAVQSIDKDLRILGIQWHPEFLYTSRDIEKKLFDYVVNEL